MFRWPLPRRRKTSCVVVVTALMSSAAWAVDTSQLAPATPEKPWVIPSPAEAVTRIEESNKRSGLRRPAELEAGNAVAIERGHRYDLAELIDLAQRISP